MIEVHTLVLETFLNGEIRTDLPDYKKGRGLKRLSEENLVKI